MSNRLFRVVLLPTEDSTHEARVQVVFNTATACGAKGSRQKKSNIWEFLSISLL